MYAQKVVVHYTDGSTADVTMTQWAIGQFAQYAQSRGWNIDTNNPGLIGMVMVRYQAYCELFRDPTKARPSYDKWDMTVDEVEVVGDPMVAGDVTPTETATSDA